MRIGGPMAYRYFIRLAYEGTAYGGWQIQPNASTVQQTLEKGLSAITGNTIAVTGCGRTDAGVHASSFFAHFDHEVAFSEDELKQLVFRLNRFLPHDIVVYAISAVLPGAHARYSALWREYEYFIIRQKDPFSFKHAYYVHDNLNIEEMNVCSAMLIGKHNFESFSKTHTQVNNYNCDVKSALWVAQSHKLTFTIRADRFLRNMVRALVGTILDVGRGKISQADFRKIIELQNRSAAGYSVPAKGLTLTGIGYPENIYTAKPVLFSPESGDKIISHYYTDSEFHQSTGNETDK